MRQKTVLLVNEVSARESLAQSLRKEGFTVIPAVDQHEALSKFEANKIDLIVLDVDLGHKLGWAAFKRLANRVPLVVMRAAGEKPVSRRSPTRLQFPAHILHFAALHRLIPQQHTSLKDG